MWLAILTALHILGATVFVGSNVLLERLTKRSEALPQREAARLAELLGADLAVMNGTALIVLAVSGFARMWIGGTLARVVDWGFIWSPYGAALITMIILWAGVAVSATFMTFYFRPRLSVKLPYGTPREVIEERGMSAMSAASWIGYLGTFNLTVGLITLVEAGFLKYGGYKTQLPPVVEDFVRALGEGSGSLYPAVLFPVGLLGFVLVLLMLASHLAPVSEAERRERFFSSIFFKIAAVVVVASDVYVVVRMIMGVLGQKTGSGAETTLWISYLLISVALLSLLLFEALRRQPPRPVSLPETPESDFLVPKY